MITTLESGRHVTPERIRADGEAMERAGFRLVYECPLQASDEERRRHWEYWRQVHGTIYRWQAATRDAYQQGGPL